MLINVKLIYYIKSKKGEIMRSIFSSLKKSLEKIKPIEPGLYQFQSHSEEMQNNRLHLRVDKNGTGILIINAKTVLHLNQSAAEIAYYYINNLAENDAIKKITRRYAVPFEQAKQDYSSFLEKISAFISTPDLDPVTFFNFDRQPPYSGAIMAPYRLDCAITYHLPQVSDLTLAPQNRVVKELSAQEWKNILEKAWIAGIPHVFFTGGEPTLREDLSQIISYAQQLGQVTGLATDGTHIADKKYLLTMLDSGLDHIIILLDSDNPTSWEAIKNSVAEDIYTAAHITITPSTKTVAFDMIKTLSGMGINAISLSTNSIELKPELLKIRDFVADQHLSLIWDLPVPYSHFNPINSEILQTEVAQGAGRAWLYVEPDGDVLPAQGINQNLGNFLSDTWDKIWTRAINYVPIE